MALPQSALSELLEAFRAGDGVDLIRESVRVALQDLIELEATERIGAAPYERTESRVTERNGHRPRMLTTKAGDVELTLGFSFPDVGEQWALEVRRGVAQLHKGIPEGTALRLSMDKRFMETLLTGEGGLVKGALLGDVKVEGNLLDIRRFLSCFDFSDEAFGLTLR